MKLSMAAPFLLFQSLFSCQVSGQENGHLRSGGNYKENLGAAPQASGYNKEEQLQQHRQLASYTMKEKISVFFNHLVENKIERLVEDAKDALGIKAGDDESDSSESWSDASLDSYWSEIVPTTMCTQPGGAQDIPCLNGDDLMDSHSKWDEYEEYWTSISNTVQGTNNFDKIKETMKVYFVETTALTFGTWKKNYGIVGLATDALGNRYVIFPGAHGLQLHYGTENHYYNYGYVNQHIGSSGGKGRVHRNYLKEWNAVKSMVQSHVDSAPDHENVIFTGHSKGGMQAALASVEMTIDGYHPKNKVHLYIFGAPNLGNYQASEAISTYVGGYAEASWILAKRKMKCGLLGTSYTFDDIIRAEEMKYKGSDGNKDWINTNKLYYPSGICEKHTFYTPSEFGDFWDFKVDNGQTWSCDAFDNAYWYHKDKQTGIGMTDAESNDYKIGERAKSHQLSYILSAMN